MKFLEFFRNACISRNIVKYPGLSKVTLPFKLSNLHNSCQINDYIGSDEILAPISRQHSVTEFTLPSIQTCRVCCLSLLSFLCNFIEYQ